MPEPPPKVFGIPVCVDATLCAPGEAWLVQPDGDAVRVWPPSCRSCGGERWVCEEHPDRPWPHDACPGPGMPCPLCNTEEPPALPPGWTSIV